MTNGIIAIQGNHLENLELIFKAFRCVDKKNDLKFGSGIPALNYLFDNYFDFANQNIGLKGITYENGWTIIIDPEMVDAGDTEKVTEISKQLNSVIYTFLSEKTSGHIEFSKIQSSIIRQFCYTDSEVIINKGNPLAEELSFNFNEKVFYDDLIGLANKLGIDIELNNATNIIVKQLEFDEDFKNELEVDKQTMDEWRKKNIKPWWKFW